MRQKEEPRWIVFQYDADNWTKTQHRDTRTEQDAMDMYMCMHMHAVCTCLCVMCAVCCVLCAVCVLPFRVCVFSVSVSTAVDVPRVVSVCGTNGQALSNQRRKEKLQRVSMIGTHQPHIRGASMQSHPITSIHTWSFRSPWHVHTLTQHTSRVSLLHRLLC